MIRLKIQNSYFRVLDGYDIKESSREVNFSSLKIDFTNKTIADLPLKYQEVQLVDVDEEYNINDIIYTGYVNNFVLPKMKNREEFRELEIDLISPLAMATIRTVDAVGTYNLQPLVLELIQPLIDDGFVLKEINIGNNEITVNYLTETVESALNKLSNKFDFWWYIDKNKNIYINSISYLIARNPKLIYDDNNPINGLIDVIPSIDATDYCNVVDFTNLRLFVYSVFQKHGGDEYLELSYTLYNPIMQKTEIKSGEEIEFDIPFDITPSNYLKSISQLSYEDPIIFASFTDTNNQTITFQIDLVDNEIVLSNNLSIEDSYGDSNDFVLVRDGFFKNLIVGLKYNGANTLQVDNITTPNALMWTKMKVINNEEVYRNKGIISDTGIVEKQIDMNEQWKFYDEIIDIANSYIKKNTSKVEQVKLNVDKNIGLEIGDTIKIDKECFLINDIYIITDKTIVYDNNVETWKFTLKNTNILENYVDLFRASEQEEIKDKTLYLITANYLEDVNIRESYEVTEL